MQICCGALKKKNQQEPEKNTIWKAVHPLNNSTSASSYLVPTTKVRGKRQENKSRACRNNDQVKRLRQEFEFFAMYAFRLLWGGFG